MLDLRLCTIEIFDNTKHCSTIHCYVVTMLSSMFTIQTCFTNSHSSTSRKNSVKRISPLIELHSVIRNRKLEMTKPLLYHDTNTLAKTEIYLQTCNLFSPGLTLMKKAIDVTKLTYA